MEKRRSISVYILINIILLLLAILVVFGVSIYYETSNTQISEIPDAVINTEIIYIETSTNPTIKQDEPKIEQNLVEPTIPIIETEALTNTAEEVLQTENTEIEEIDKKYKYYYYQLNDSAKKIYNEIEKNKEKMKNGTYVLDLSKQLSNVLEEKGFDSLNNDFQSAWDAIILDRVELFYIDISKVILNVQTTTLGSHVDYKITMGPEENSNYYEEGFENEQIVNMALNQVEGIANTIVQSLEGSTYNKIKQAHDWLVDNLSYGLDESGLNSYNIYGAFIKRSVVCEGYAESFKYIMDKLGVECVLVSGIARNSDGDSENHEWNYIKIDGKWYAVDVTWDDPIITGVGSLPLSLKYKYFLKGEKEVNKNHFPDGQMSTNGIKFTYPKLEEGNY